MLLMNEEHRLVADHAQIPLRRRPAITMTMQRRALVIHDVRVTGRLALGEDEPARTDPTAPSGNPATGTSSRSPWRISPRPPAEPRFILISHSFQRFALPATSPLTTVPLKAGWRRVEPALLTHHKYTGACSTSIEPNAPTA